MTTQDLAIPGSMDTGLEDLTPGDLSVPRLKIDHPNSVYVDGASGEQMPSFFAIILGLVRQRVLFHHNVEDGDVPLCKSPDYQAGFPNLEPPKANKPFPWQLSGFDPHDFPLTEEGIIALPCDGCKLKDWGSHPTGDKPYCAEQHTLPLLYAPSLEQLEAGEWQPALISLQKSGIPASKRYLGTFRQRKVPAYTVFTKFSLNTAKRGTTTYCTPVLVKVGDTDLEAHSEFSEQYAGIREFLTNSRPNGTASSEATASPSVAPSRSAASPPVDATIVSSNVPATQVDDDELPF